MPGRGTALVFLPADISATDLDPAGSDNAKIVFSIEAGSDGFFTIDAATGAVRSAGFFDRETKGSFVLTVRATDKGVPPRFSEVAVEIAIDDFNDNDPAFPPGPYTFSIPEDSSVDRIVTTVRATDADARFSGSVSYSVLSGNALKLFKVDTTSGLITVSGALDRETMASFDLLILPVDQGALDGFTNRSGFPISVHIDVLDVNDNSPVIQLPIGKTGFALDVDENKALDSVLLLVSATDADIGLNGPAGFQYSLTDDQGKFAIDNQGYLRVSGALDREKVDFYSISVIVTDGGSPSRRDRKICNVTILDKNDNAPKFDLNFYSSILAEDAPAGSLVAIVAATDSDLGANAEIDFFISNANGQDATFVLTARPGGTAALNISMPSRLDRETIDSYTLEITARDRGSPALLGKATVTLAVTDINDNSPTFDSASYQVTINENVIAGSYIFGSTAADKDVGSNARITYGLVPVAPNVNVKFTINPATGLVSTLSAFNLAGGDLSMYTFNLTATDGGLPQRSAVSFLAVNVSNVNSNSPIFEQPLYTATPLESAGLDTQIVRVLATDSDNNVLQYSIQSGNDNNLFAIDKATGNITLAGPLDRETRSTYTLSVVAKDTGVPPRFGFCTVQVTVRDINDNKPRFQFQQYSATVTECGTGVSGLLAKRCEGLVNVSPRNYQGHRRRRLSQPQRPGDIRHLRQLQPVLHHRRRHGRRHSCPERPLEPRGVARVSSYHHGLRRRRPAVYSHLLHQAWRRQRQSTCVCDVQSSRLCTLDLRGCARGNKHCDSRRN